MILFEMGSRGRLLFDLNELPSEDKEEETVVILPCVPQKSFPISNPHPSSFLPALEGGLRIVNNCSFTHAVSASGFQPFVRVKQPQVSKKCQMREDDTVVRPEAAANCCEPDIVEEVMDCPEVQTEEKEEGELSNVEGDTERVLCSDFNSKFESGMICPDAGLLNTNKKDNCPDEGLLNTTKKDDCPDAALLNTNKKDNCSDTAMLDVNVESCMHESSNESRENSLKETRSSNEGRVCSINDVKVSDLSTEGDAAVDVLDDPSSIVKQKEIKGVEAIYALRLAKLNPAKKAKYEEEQKLGKLGKTKPKTILVDMEDVKNNSYMKSSLRKQCSLSPATVTRTVKDALRPTPVVDQIIWRPDQTVVMDKKQSEAKLGGASLLESGEHSSESYADNNVGSHPCLEKINENDSHKEMHPRLAPRQSLWKQSTSCKQFGDLTFSPHRQIENRQGTTNTIAVNKSSPPSKKQSLNNHRNRLHLWKGFSRR